MSNMFAANLCVAEEGNNDVFARVEYFEKANLPADVKSACRIAAEYAKRHNVYATTRSKYVVVAPDSHWQRSISFIVDRLCQLDLDHPPSVCRGGYTNTAGEYMEEWSILIDVNDLWELQEFIQQQESVLVVEKGQYSKWYAHFATVRGAISGARVEALYTLNAAPEWDAKRAAGYTQSLHNGVYFVCDKIS